MAEQPVDLASGLVCLDKDTGGSSGPKSFLNELDSKSEDKSSNCGTFTLELLKVKGEVQEEIVWRGRRRFHLGRYRGKEQGGRLSWRLQRAPSFTVCARETQHRIASGLVRYQRSACPGVQTTRSWDAAFYTDFPATFRLCRDTFCQ